MPADAEKSRVAAILTSRPHVHMHAIHSIYDKELAGVEMDAGMVRMTRALEERSQCSNQDCIECSQV
jgi:hypothetical protein